MTTKTHYVAPCVCVHFKLTQTVIVSLCSCRHYNNCGEKTNCQLKLFMTLFDYLKINDEILARILV